MVKGYYLKYSPYMDEYNEKDILGDLDLLKLDKKGISEVKKGAIKRFPYIGKKFYIIVFKFNNNNEADDGREESLYNIYSLLSKALPNFIKVFRLDKNTIIAAYPYYYDISEDCLYALLIDELLRITGFLLLSMSNSGVIGFLKDYVNINVFIEENKK